MADEDPGLLPLIVQQSIEELELREIAFRRQES